VNKRCFLAVPLTDYARNHIKKLGILPGRKVPLEKLHLTLHFLGNVEEQALNALIKELKTTPLGQPFEIQFSELGAFPKQTHARVLWLGVKKGSEELNQLVLTLGEKLKALNFKIEERPYLPHLTISRLDPPKNLTTWIDFTSFKPFVMPAQEIILYQSVLEENQSRYLELQRYPFLSKS